jgi:hypothetical protein
MEGKSQKEKRIKGEGAKRRNQETRKEEEQRRSRAVDKKREKEKRRGISLKKERKEEATKRGKKRELGRLDPTMEENRYWSKSMEERKGKGIIKEEESKGKSGKES